MYTAGFLTDKVFSLKLMYFDPATYTQVIYNCIDAAKALDFLQLVAKTFKIVLP